MPTFNSVSEMVNWVNTNQGQNHIFDEAKTKRMLIDAGHKLQKLLIEELDNYFASYMPVSGYKRTGNTIGSIHVGEPMLLTTNQWELSINFDEGLGNHPSLFGGEEGFTPWLLNSGWEWKNQPTTPKEHFTRFVGTNYINKAVERFNSENEYGLKIEVLHNGEDVTGRIYSYGK
jgi:hypothetical protein